MSLSFYISDNVARVPEWVMLVVLGVLVGWVCGRRFTRKRS